MKNYLLLVFAAWVLPAVAAESLDSLDLEGLLNIDMKTSVATKKEVTARATPGVVTIITDEEIRNMGAVDLMDVLRTVPSINFGVDVQGVAGLGIRGMWAHEGKHLLLIDGIEMNEIQYGTTQLGNHYPVDQIKRIEIIRGPGSAIYGGFAELAVINIITKSGAEIHGAGAQGTYGRMEENSERANYSVYAGQKSGDFDFSGQAYFGHAHRGEGLYSGVNTDIPASGSFDFKDADELKAHYINAGLKTENFNFRFIYDDYAVSTRSMFGFTGVDENIPNEFRSMNFAANYVVKASDKVTVTPYLHYYRQAPWVQTDEVAFATYKVFDIRSQRFKAGANASMDLTPNMNLLTGLEYTDDRHNIRTQKDTTGPIPFRTGGDDFNMNNKALLAQLLMDAGGGTVTVGARYEDSSHFKSSFVPRAGYTLATEHAHVKALYSNAFRSPVLFNIDIEPNIKPEKTQTFEVEGGLSTSKASYLTANIYYTKIKDPIIYFYDTTDRYANFGDVATKGLEADWRWKSRLGQVQVGYAYYELDTNKVDRYQISKTDDALLGMPQHQAVLSSFVFLGSKDLKLGPTLIYQGEKYAFESDASAGAMVESKLPAVVLANLYLAKENLLVNGLSGGVGVNNIFSNDYRLVQPYNGGHGTVPGPTREAYVRAEYKLNF